VQISAEFSGGAKAWKFFLEKNLNINTPRDKGAPEGIYKVILSFLVDKDGTLSTITTENNPGYGTAEEAIRIMKNSPKWRPAVQNGHNVSSTVKQSITFIVSKE